MDFMLRQVGEPSVFLLATILLTSTCDDLYPRTEILFSCYETGMTRTLALAIVGDRERTIRDQILEGRINVEQLRAVRHHR